MYKVHGVGTNSRDTYKARENGKITPAYNKWDSMMGRCYSEKAHKKRKNYKGCHVCEEWHEFQVFAEWYYDNCPDHSYCLDKDIMVKGNKTYSPETCCFVPIAINNLFEGNMRGTSRSSSKLNPWRAWYNEGKKQIHLGLFKTEEEAFMAYVMAKETWIKKVAENYKDKIPKKVYSAMVSFKIQESKVIV